jgi:heat-inducible transcriptional repressor
VLVIVVSTGGQITHKVVETGEPCDRVMLNQAANYINGEFAGLTLDEVRAAIEDRMRQERMLYDALAARALRIAQDGLGGEDPEKTLHVQGASLLLDELLGAPADREQTIETMRALIRMIEEKHRLIGLLTRYIDAPGLTIVIGAEHGLPDLRPFAVVASTFKDGDRTGAVGVIGPTRMRYQRAISVVDALSSAVEHVLEGQTPDRN